MTSYQVNIFANISNITRPYFDIFLRNSDKIDQNPNPPTSKYSVFASSTRSQNGYIPFKFIISITQKGRFRSF